MMNPEDILQRAVERGKWVKILRSASPDVTGIPEGTPDLETGKADIVSRMAIDDPGVAARTCASGLTDRSTAAPVPWRVCRSTAPVWRPMPTAFLNRVLPRPTSLPPRRHGRPRPPDAARGRLIQLTRPSERGWPHESREHRNPALRRRLAELSLRQADDRGRRRRLERVRRGLRFAGRHERDRADAWPGRRPGRRRARAGLRRALLLHPAGRRRGGGGGPGRDRERHAGRQGQDAGRPLP